MGGGRINRYALIAALGMSATAVPVIAQPAGVQSIPPSLGQAVTDGPISPILTIDQDRLFQGSLYGKQVAEELEALSNDLAVENRGIEAQLTQEERALTALRPSLTPQEFTARADAFDARVEDIRRRQDAKGRDLARRHDLARAAFIQSVLPVLSAMMRERGAVAILNAQAIFLSFGTIDITDAAIERLDERIGAGPGLPLPESGEVAPPDDTPDPAPTPPVSP
ncbi:Skp family chaperone for outer membrane proteins [Rhodobacteraceae bacterium MBR-64]|jgi:Skp family chaperone for outer membrane proteins